MDEYISREALVDALSKVASEVEYADGKNKYLFAYGTLTGVRKSIIYTKAAPAADVVEVVRCKNCKNFVANGQGTWCRKQSCIHTAHRSPNDFCSYGERKGGVQE